MGFDWELEILRSASCKENFLHHHKHQGLDPLIPSVSRAIAALANIF